jgi:hypothetical protein
MIMYRDVPENNLQLKKRYENDNIFSISGWVCRAGGGGNPSFPQMLD